MHFDAVIFDLDGTLIDTLEDLTWATNAALREFGLKEKTVEEVRALVGRGIRELVRDASGLEGDDLEKCVQRFQAHYEAHLDVFTKPYGGVVELLTQLRANGIKVAVLSNKYESAAKRLCAKFFPNLIDFVIGGDHAGIAKKPDPSGAQLALRLLRCERPIYCGDTATDIQTARAARIKCVAVSWGFRARETLSQADVIIDRAEEFIPAADALSRKGRGKKAVFSLLLALLLLAGAFFAYRHFGPKRYPIAEDKGMAVPYISQKDYTKTVCTIDGIKRSVKSSGCGATCIAMVSRYYFGEDASSDPQALFEWAYQNRFYAGNGIGHEGMDALAAYCGLKSRWTDDMEEARTALSEQQLVIAHMGPGEFTGDGHYILLRGIAEDGTILVNDPNSETRSAKNYEMPFIAGQLKINPGFLILWRE